MKSISSLSKTKMSQIRSNRLRLARKRLSYEQKQIASLMGYKAVPSISRYETGQQIPSLKIALKFSILYRLPIRVLFDTYYDECRRELNTSAEKLKQKPIFWDDLTEPTDYCSYVEMMNTSFLTDIDKKKVQKHILILMNDRRQKILGH